LPLIAGKFLPSPPRDPPELDNTQWVKHAYLTPWDLVRHMPPWPLSWHGLEGWRASLDLTVPLHRGRWQLARNLATAAFNDHPAKDIAFRYRRRTAHTYADYQAMRENPLTRERMDAAEMERLQGGVDPEHAGSSGGSALREDAPVHDNAQRIN
jgi:hypothetical protein